MTSLEQLSVAEFSGEQTRPKVYENGHKKVLGIWLDLVLRVKFSMSKISRIFTKKNSLTNTKMGDNLLLIPNFDFQCTL